MSPTSRKAQFAQGSASGRTPSSAACRAVYEWITLGLKADKVCAELDNITVPGVKKGLDKNDSLVIALEDFGHADE